MTSVSSEFVIVSELWLCWPVCANSTKRSSALRDELYGIIPADHGQPYNARHLLECLLDDGHLDEFQADYAKKWSLTCAHSRHSGLGDCEQPRHDSSGRHSARLAASSIQNRPRRRPTSSNLQSPPDALSVHSGRFRFYGRAGGGTFESFVRARASLRRWRPPWYRSF